MLYQIHLPRKPVNIYVDSICYIEGNNKGTGLPKMAMSMVFNLEDPFKLFTDGNFSNHIDYKRHWVAGLQTQPAHVESYGTSKMFVVQFKALGAFAFLNDPLHYYTNSYITLDTIFKQEADETWEQLQECHARSEQFLILENFLCRKLLVNKPVSPKLIATINMLLAQNRTFSISHICERLDISRKHFNHLSKEFAGVSPKTLSSLYRLQRTLKTISDSPANKLTDVGYKYDYFDQAHFINDFKKYTGLTPYEYARIASAKDSLKVVPHFIPFE